MPQVGLANEMAKSSSRTHRPPRVDSIRNRIRVLEAAKVVFNAGGSGASLDAVAREAGVGIATLYRHFPTREALYEAVYRHEVDELAGLAERLVAESAPPTQAMRQWLGAAVEFVATKKGAAALALAAQGPQELIAYSTSRLTEAVALLLNRAVAKEELRDVIEPGDLLRALIGMCYLHNQGDWRKRVRRMLDVLVDGLVAGQQAPIVRKRTGSSSHRVSLKRAGRRESRP
jgi:AcrR family transcriptional regulator